jgi:hypothetical protein
VLFDEQYWFLSAHSFDAARLFPLHFRVLEYAVSVCACFGRGVSIALLLCSFFWLSAPSVVTDYW